MSRTDKLPPLAKAIREGLAMNAHNDDESLLRCTCDDCVSDLAKSIWRLRPRADERLRELYAAIADAAYTLPIPKELLDSEAVERFKLALHFLHVEVSETAE